MKIVVRDGVQLKLRRVKIKDSQENTACNRCAFSQDDALCRASPKCLRSYFKVVRVTLMAKWK